jgi:hypothetical protein
MTRSWEKGGNGNRRGIGLGSVLGLQLDPICHAVVARRRLFPLSVSLLFLVPFLLLFLLPVLLFFLMLFLPFLLPFSLLIPGLLIFLLFTFILLSLAAVPHLPQRAAGGSGICGIVGLIHLLVIHGHAAGGAGDVQSLVINALRAGGEDLGLSDPAEQPKA